MRLGVRTIDFFDDDDDDNGPCFVRQFDPRRLRLTGEIDPDEPVQNDPRYPLPEYFEWDKDELRNFLRNLAAAVFGSDSSDWVSSRR